MNFSDQTVSLVHSSGLRGRTSLPNFFASCTKVIRTWLFLSLVPYFIHSLNCFRILKEDFKVKKPLPSLFIDTYYHPSEPHERAKFAENTNKLLTFAQSVKPFECKDIEIALHEIREMQNSINSLKNENAERTRIMQQLLVERHELEAKLAVANSGTTAPAVQDRRESSLFCANNK